MRLKDVIGKLKWRIHESLYIYKWVMAIKIDENNWKYINNNLKEWEADPFIIKENDKYYVFYENLKIGNKGTIYVGEIDLETMEVKNKREILNEDFHLSYPNVFKIKEKYYMIPETHEANKLILYEAEKFPDKWRRKKTLIENISCADTTILEKEGIHYFFFSPLKDENKYPWHCHSLECYYTEDILNKDLKPIKNNVVSDSIEYSRMGGNFLQYGEEIYRFSQDCKNIYGETLNLHKVKNISTDSYEEELLKKLKKPEKTLGMHTYTNIDDIEIIDLYIKQFRFGKRNKIFRFKFGIKK